MWTTVTCKITPERAAYLLSQMGEQRRVRADAVTRYATEMAEGRWRTSILLVDSDGRVVDGQHRLLAVVQSGATIDCVVITGPRPELLSMTAVRENSADRASKLLGMTMSSRTNSVLQYLASLGRLPPGQATPEQVARCTEAARIARLGRCECAAVAAVLYELTPDEAERWMRDVRASATSAAGVWGRWYERHRTHRVDARDGIQRAARRALDAWRKGETISESALTRARG